MGQFLKDCKEDDDIYQLFTSEQNIFYKSLFYVNTRGAILWCNEYAMKEFNRNMHGKTAHQIFSGKSANKCNKDNLEIIKSRSRVYINETLKLITGEEKNFFTIKSPWIVAKQQVAGIFASVVNMEQFEVQTMENNLSTNQVNRLYFDVQCVLNETLINIHNNDKHLELQRFTKKLLSSCEKSLTNLWIVNTEKIMIGSQLLNLRNLIQEIVTQETKFINCPNFRFICTAADQVPEIVVGDFFRIRKIVQLIVKNLLKSAVRLKIFDKDIICQINLLYHNSRALIIFETEYYLVEKWFLKEHKLQHKLSVMPEFSSDKNCKFGLSLIKDLIKELNGNIDLIDFNKSIKMIINIPVSEKITSNIFQ